MGFHLMIFIWFILGMFSGILISFEFFLFDSFGMEFIFMFDLISLGFSSFILLISSVVFMYSNYYMMGDLGLIRFYMLMFMFVLSMMFLVYGYGFFSLMIGWDGLGIVSFLLVVYYYNFYTLRSGLLTILSNRVGDLSMLFSFYCFFCVGWWTAVCYSYSNFYVISFLLIFSAMTKSAQLPFSAWLPAAMAAPTPVSSLVHSSTLVTAGVYLLIRFYYSLSFFLSSGIFCIISLMTMFFSGFLALYDNDVKSIIAMSTLSQLGFMMFSLSIGEWMFGFFHMICHALYKSLLFLSCGSFIVCSFGNQDLRGKVSMNYGSSFFFLLFAFSSMSLFGFPFLSGFFSKDFILEVSFLGGFSFLLMMMLMISCSFSLVYSMRLLFYGLWYYVNSFSLISFYSIKSSVAFLLILFSWSLLWGYYLGMYSFCDNMFFVFSKFKILSFTLLFMGIMLFYLFYVILNMNFYSEGLSDFFFLYWMSSSSISLLSKKWIIFSFNDASWLELIGPKVFFKLGSSSSYLISLEYVFYKIIYLFVGILIYLSILLIY